MEVVEIAEPGGPEVLRLAERPIPKPQAGEVLIRVSAAGVNRPDVLQRLGHHPPPPGASDIPGLEVSGTIVACGPGAEGRVGTTVCALLGGGGYAQYAIAPYSLCLPIPERLSLREAAAIPETFFTVWDNVFTRARLKAGESFLVHGGSSGIGTAAIQLGAAFGARVLATAGSVAKCVACKALGAERAVLYKTEDFVAASQEFTSGAGLDVVLDMVGGPYLARNLEALGIEGRLALIAYLGGDSAALPIATLLRKRLTLFGSTLRPRSVAEKAAIARSLTASVWPLLAKGTVRPVLFRGFALKDAAAAHALLESGEHIGKIVLDVAAPEGGLPAHHHLG
jgi:NADPH2:quinone reductase